MTNEQQIREAFAAQMENNKSIKNPDSLMGSPIYTEYRKGDKMLAFLERIENDDETVNYNMRVTVEREIPELANDYQFLDLMRSFPVLEKKTS